MSPASDVRPFGVRHLQLARALFAALAAIMITFSPDHSAPVGLAVFSGFAIATGLVFFLAVWLVYPAGRRWPTVLLGILTIAAGMVTGIGVFRTNEMFLIVVITWAASTGLVELVSGWRALRPRAVRAEDERFAVAPMPRTEAREAVTVGVISLILAIALAFVNSSYALDYYIAEAEQTYTLTGIIIAVGLFGGYAAIVAVYLAIAAFSPKVPVVEETPAREDVA